jgi:hypothetical protein
LVKEYHNKIRSGPQPALITSYFPVPPILTRRERLGRLHDPVKIATNLVDGAVVVGLPNSFAVFSFFGGEEFEWSRGRERGLGTVFVLKGRASGGAEGPE